jgi:hypothetical protein
MIRIAIYFTLSMQLDRAMHGTSVDRGSARRPEMRTIIAGTVVIVVGLGVSVGNAQVYQLPTPVPQVTAATAEWQLRAEPIFYSGDFYYPTGPSVFFDGNVMVRSGVYQGVPLYVDATLEPYSIVYVPVGRNVMRPYERPRAGSLTGTTGSRTPSFPIVRDVELSSANAGTGLVTPPAGDAERNVIPESVRTVGTVGSLATRASADTPAPRSASSSRARLAPVTSIPAPTATRGIWLPFNGSRWYSDGAAVPYIADQFVAVGTYHDVPVYQKRGDSPREIYVPAVTGGLLAPYRRP